MATFFLLNHGCSWMLTSVSSEGENSSAHFCNGNKDDKNFSVQASREGVLMALKIKLKNND